MPEVSDGLVPEIKQSFQNVDKPPPIKIVKRLTKKERIEMANAIDPFCHSKYEPFWNDQKQFLSDQTWKPKSNNLISKKVVDNTWFDIETQRRKITIKGQKRPEVSTVNSMRYKVAKFPKSNPEGIKNIRVRIRPTPEQEKTIQEYLNGFRWYYNACSLLFTLNNKEFYKESHFSNSYIRDKIMHKYEYCDKDGEPYFKYDPDRNKMPIPEFFKSLHSRVSRGAVIKFTAAINSVISNYQEDNLISVPVMNFATKKDLIHICRFEDCQYPDMFNKIEKKYWYTNKEGRREFILLQKHDLKKGFEIMYEVTEKKYYLNIPVSNNWYPEADRRIDKQNSLNRFGNNHGNERIIALDPGVRKFMVGYDPDGKILICGQNAHKKLSKMLDKIEDIEMKNGSKKDLFLIRKKIRNRIADLHWKTINHLISNYDSILYPDFRITKMVKGYRLPRIIKRLLYSFSFYQFNLKLINSSFRYGKKLVIVSESFTSKTCGNCGEINEVGSKETYKCQYCNFEMDRDIMASRNIYIKNVAQR